MDAPTHPLRTLLIEEEGRVPYAYQDNANGKCPTCGNSQGYWTIAVGRLIDRRRGGRLTEAEIDFLLSNDMGEKSALARRLAGFNQLNEIQQAALVSMVFQLGFTGVGCFPKFCAALRDGDQKRAAIEGRHSKWAREDSPRRAERQMRMLESGLWVPFNLN